MSKKSQKNYDPRWIMARFDCSCKQCGEAINKGRRGYYWPSSKAMYCIECGMEAARDVMANDSDKVLTRSQFLGGYYD